MNLSQSTEKGLLTTLAAVNFVHIVDFMILMPLAPYLIAAFDISSQQFSWLVSLYAISAAVSGILMSVWVDRFERRRLFLAVFTVFTVATFACALAPSFAVLLVARMLAGATGGLLTSMVRTIVADVVEPARRGQAMGHVMMGFGAASVLGVPLGLSIAASNDSLAWRGSFIFVAVMALFIGALAARYLPTLAPLARRQQSWVAQYWDSLSAPGHARGLLFAALVVLGSFTVIPFIALYSIKNVGIGAEQLSWIYLVGGIASLLVSKPVGRWVDRQGAARVFTFGALGSVVPVAVITNLPPVALAWLLVITTLFFIAMSARIVPAQTWLSLVPSAASRGRFMAVQNSIEQMAMGVASLIAGLLVHIDSAGRLIGYPTVGLVAIGFSLCAIGVLHYWPQTRA